MIEAPTTETAAERITREAADAFERAQFEAAEETIRADALIAEIEATIARVVASAEQQDA